MSWVITARQNTPSAIGEAFGGGYFAGYISHTADSNPTHLLIVAPRATGATGSGYTLSTSLQWKTTNTTTAGTSSQFDGAANTAAMVAAGIASHPAANFCVALNIGGFTDWYLPARHELGIAYFNLKPTTTNNNQFSGVNPYSVPRRLGVYSASSPGRTPLTAWQAPSGAEAFVTDYHASSTEDHATLNGVLYFENGDVGSAGLKTAGQKIRAFRRIAL